MLGRVYSFLPFKAHLGRLLARRFMESPIFVVGCGRSGTTVLVTALDEHSQLISGRHEAPLYRDIGSIGYRYCCSREAEYLRQTTQISADQLRHRLRILCFESMWGKDYGCKEHLKRIVRQRPGHGSYLELRHWVAKAFPPEDEAKGLLWLFPRARFLYIYRNGIDVVSSMTKHRAFRERGFVALCHFWADRVEHYRYLTRWEKATSLRQEDLLAYPDGEFRRIFDFLGIGNEPGPAEYARSTLVHPLGQPTEKADVREALSKRKPGYTDWTQEQMSTFRGICGEAMQELAYEIPF
jgi:hypothetical protein